MSNLNFYRLRTYIIIYRLYSSLNCLVGVNLMFIVSVQLQEQLIHQRS